MSRRRRWAMAVVAGGVLACGRPRARTAQPQAPSPQAVAPLSTALLGDGAESMTSPDAIDALLEAPEVAAAGQRLLDRLGRDPDLQPLYDGLFSGMMTQPAMMEAMAAVAARDPGLSADALAEQVIARLSEGIDGPVFDAALDASLDRLLDRPRVDAAFDRLADALIERARFGERLEAWLRQWQPELEAAVGVPMHHEQFPERMEAYLGQPDRRRRLRALFRTRVMGDPRARQGLVALLESDAFFGACARLVRSVLTSPDFEANTTAVFAGMIEQVDAEQMRRRVDRILVTPPIEQAVVEWADALLGSDALTTFARRLGEIFDDPNLQAELYDVLVGSSAAPTARIDHGPGGGACRPSPPVTLFPLERARGGGPTRAAGRNRRELRAGLTVRHGRRGRAGLGLDEFIESLGSHPERSERMIAPRSHRIDVGVVIEWR